MRSIITTKKGDEGNSILPDGRVVPKSSEFIECLGALESLRAHIALLNIKIENSQHTDRQIISDFLFWLIHCLFITGSQLADPFRKVTPPDHPVLSEEHLKILEKFQIHLENKLNLPRKFIVSGSNEISAFADIVVTFARNFERKLVTYLKTPDAAPVKNSALIPFYNRLGDFLFILARILDKDKFITVDYSIISKPPIPNEDE